MSFKIEEEIKNLSKKKTKVERVQQYLTHYKRNTDRVSLNKKEEIGWR